MHLITYNEAGIIIGHYEQCMKTKGVQSNKTRVNSHTCLNIRLGDIPAKHEKNGRVILSH